MGLDVQIIALCHAKGAWEVITVNGKELHAQAVRLPVHELVSELLDHLGPTLVAALAGSRDRKQP
ncbi:hypothetical protein H5U98_23600 [Mycolicibacterium boenickei]|uniref:Uncharacterized protein n=1 Tax=Mycolicibacterium boenickei TaxID=146017 RepID=A0AAX2ZTI2_9MYCO|nr:hypothetical protein [Mycolicibacterium boenickei]UNB98496.1 hypothetical protein H5U98_23600 [Mycolicibacterium boenickei]BBX94311.1 hypothetical protein MBOE_59600 [Mycolicibacterium boenickei]